MSEDNPLKPVCDVLSILESLENGSELCPQDRRLLASAIRSYIDHGTPIERALGLVKKGQPALIDRIRAARSDQFLVMAIKHTPVVDRNSSNWKRCQVLAPLLLRYQAGSLASDLRNGGPIGNTLWRIYAFEAAEVLGRPLPCTADALDEVLKRHRARLHQRSEGTMAAYFLPPPCPDPLSASPSSAPSGQP